MGPSCVILLRDAYAHYCIVQSRSKGSNKYIILFILYIILSILYINYIIFIMYIY